jgi:hypothetical protein
MTFSTWPGCQPGFFVARAPRDPNFLRPGARRLKIAALFALC